MECTISINNKVLKKLVGKNMTKEKFASFCKDAVASKLLEKQITNFSNKCKKDQFK